MDLKEFLKEKGWTELGSDGYWDRVDLKDVLEFTKYHVQQALEKASKDALVERSGHWGNVFNQDDVDSINTNRQFDEVRYGHGDSTVNRYAVNVGSILNAYKLSNIK